MLDSVDPSTPVSFLLKAPAAFDERRADRAQLPAVENGQLSWKRLNTSGACSDTHGRSAMVCYHPLFGSFLRQRCQWELAVELPDPSRRR